MAKLDGKLEQSEEENGLGGRVVLGVVMADTGIKVLINGGKDSLPVVEAGLMRPEETTTLAGTIAAEILASRTAGEEIQAVKKIDSVAELCSSGIGGHGHKDGYKRPTCC